MVQAFQCYDQISSSLTHACLKDEHVTNCLMEGLQLKESVALTMEPDSGKPEERKNGLD